MTNDPRQFCSFDVGEFRFGIDVNDVQEILRPQDVTLIPRTPTMISGLMNLRGQIVLVIDLRERFALSERGERETSAHVIVSTKDGPVCLVVDRARDVLALDTTHIGPPPQTLDPTTRELIVGAVQLEHCLLLIIDAQRCTDVQKLLRTHVRQLEVQP